MLPWNSVIIPLIAASRSLWADLPKAGGSPEGRGVVATASYEAREFGVRSAMPSRQALQLCPHAIFVRPRFDAYKEASRQIRAIFKRYTDLIEPLSLDEAFLDVTEDKQNINSAIVIAEQIMKAIVDELQLTASAGVSVNKFVAKIASDMKKPNGLTFIGPSRMSDLYRAFPDRRLYGNPARGEIFWRRQGNSCKNEGHGTAYRRGPEKIIRSRTPATLR